MNFRALRSTLLSALLALSLVALGVTGVFADQRDFTLINNSSIPITHVFVSQYDADDWGDDLLGEDVLDSGDSFDITFSGPLDTCVWDIKVLGQGGQEGYLYKVDLCHTSTVSFSDA